MKKIFLLLSAALFLTTGGYAVENEQNPLAEAVMKQDLEYLQSNLTPENVNMQYENIPVETRLKWPEYGAGETGPREIAVTIKGKATLLHLAAYYNLHKAAQMLIEKNADVTALNSERQTPLETAVNIATVDTRQTQAVLIKAKSNVNIIDRNILSRNNHPLLLTYLLRGDFDLAELSVLNGADIAFLEPYTLFKLKKTKGAEKLVKMLKERSAKK